MEGKAQIKNHQTKRKNEEEMAKKKHFAINFENK